MTDKYCIRILTCDDVDIYKNIRLEALYTTPESFGGEYEEEILLSDEEFRSTLSKNEVFGIFFDNQIIGCAILTISAAKKLKHDGNIFSLYITPLHQGKGAGKKLLNHIIEYAKSKVIQLCLYCNSDNHYAIKFYQKQGFITVGIYPRSMKVGDKYYDSDIMILKLD